MPRLLLNDELWSKLRPILLQHQVYDKPNLRLTVEGMLYRMRIGCLWRDLPKAFGRWNSVYARFNLWSAKEVWLSIFNKLVVEPDFEWLFIDGSYVKAHQHSSGAATQESEAIGKSRAGNTSKIHLLVDAHGLPVAFEITGGEVNDCQVAPVLLESLPKTTRAVVADKGYDSKTVREQIAQQGALPIIPRRSHSRQGNENMDWALYRLRHLVENAFARLKHFRGVASRFDKLKRNYQSTVAMALGVIWLPM